MGRLTAGWQKPDGSGGMKMYMVEVENVCKTYKDGDVENKVLKDVNLQVKEGEFIAILGQSGSGKSTLLNLIGCLDEANSGRIILDGKVCKSQSDKVMSQYRRSMLGFVFQSFNLIPVLSVWENVVLPIQFDKKKVDSAYITELLKSLEIYDKKDSLPSKLSGGQQQRVAIARALANRPRIVLADEPTGNLDSETGEAVLDLLISSMKKYGQTLIMITHNKDIAARADRVLIMKNGKLDENLEQAG